MSPDSGQVPIIVEQALKLRDVTNPPMMECNRASDEGM